MKVIEIISEIESNYSEWLEMVDDPHRFIMGILANKIINLENQVIYLEKRLKNG